MSFIFYVILVKPEYICPLLKCNTSKKSWLHMSVTMCVYADQMISAHIINLTIGIGGREHSLMWFTRYHLTTHREHIYSW